MTRGWRVQPGSGWSVVVGLRQKDEFAYVFSLCGG